MPFSKVTELSGNDSSSSLLEALEISISDKKARGQLTPLQEAQYGVQLTWLKDDSIADTETVVFTKGIVEPEMDKSYFVMATGMQVRDAFHDISLYLIIHTTVAPLQPRKYRTQPSRRTLKTRP